MKLRSDPAEIARALAVLFQPGDVVELRIPKTKHEGTVSGYFDDHAALAKVAASRNGDPGIYVTLNPVIPALLARCANRVETHVRVTTSDKEIARRRWLLIDIDVVRPAEISSSDSEHAAALERARHIRAVLSAEGWPAPLLCDSGNGAHLLYRIDLPNDAAAAALIQAVLKALAARFSDDAMKVDVTMFNSSRITKAYGGVARKGDDIPERPHRLSRIIEEPEIIEVAPRELLEKMVPPPPPPPPSPPEPEPERKAKAEAGAAPSDDELIDRARKANDGGKFARLWDGQWEGAYASQSEADLALCMKLAFWTGRNASRIDALFRRSGLMRDKWERTDYREATIAKAIEQTTETWKPKVAAASNTASVNLNALAPSVELLNSLGVFAGRIQFRSISRRGSMILASTTENQQIIWPTTTDLTSFARTRAVIAEGTDVLLPQPPRNQVSRVWDPAADLIIRLAAKDAIRVEPALKEECQHLLVLMWRFAGQKSAANSKQFKDFLTAIKRSVRREPPAPPCVFTAEEYCWVHAPTFRNWLSIPALTNRLYPLADIRQGLLLLGFEYQKDVTRGADGDSESASLWRGPIDVLLE